MGLEKLHSSHPLQMLAQMPSHMTTAYGLPLAMQYNHERQLEDLYNQQVMNEMNPALIRNQNLQNTQLEQSNMKDAYLMPTWEAQGAEAQAKLDTPQYFYSGADATMATNRATEAEQSVKQRSIQASAADTVSGTAAKASNAATLEKAIQFRGMLDDPRVLDTPDEEVIAYIQKKWPDQADQVVPIIKAQGWRKVAPNLAKNLDAKIKQLSITQPEHIRAKDLEDLKGQWDTKKAGASAQGARNPNLYSLAHNSAIQAGLKPGTKEYNDYVQEFIRNSSASSMGRGMGIDPESGLPYEYKMAPNGSGTAANPIHLE